MMALIPYGIMPTMQRHIIIIPFNISCQLVDSISMDEVVALLHGFQVVCTLRGSRFFDVPFPPFRDTGISAMVGALAFETIRSIWDSGQCRGIESFWSKALFLPWFLPSPTQEQSRTFHMTIRPRVSSMSFFNPRLEPHEGFPECVHCFMNYDNLPLISPGPPS